MQSIIINNFVFNRINILFVSTGMLLTILTLLAARDYIKKRKKWYYVLGLSYILSFSLLIFTDNWFIFLTAWELVTLTTTLMMLWSSKKLAAQYFVIQFAGSSFYSV